MSAARRLNPTIGTIRVSPTSRAPSLFFTVITAIASFGTRPAFNSLECSTFRPPARRALSLFCVLCLATEARRQSRPGLPNRYSLLLNCLPFAYLLPPPVPQPANGRPTAPAPFMGCAVSRGRVKDRRAQSFARKTTRPRAPHTTRPTGRPTSHVLPLTR